MKNKTKELTGADLMVNALSNLVNYDDAVTVTSCESCDTIKRILIQILKCPKIKLELIKDELIKELEELE